MKKQFNVYCACPMNEVETVKQLVTNIRYNRPFLTDHFKFFIPKLVDSTYESYVFADLNLLDCADILLIHIPYPSVGACAELGYFKAKSPHKMIIAFKCMDHSWIKHLANFHCDKEECVIEILDTFLDAYYREGI